MFSRSLPSHGGRSAAACRSRRALGARDGLVGLARLRGRGGDVAARSARRSRRARGLRGGLAARVAPLGEHALDEARARAGCTSRPPRGRRPARAARRRTRRSRTGWSGQARAARAGPAPRRVGRVEEPRDAPGIDDRRDAGRPQDDVQRRRSPSRTIALGEERQQLGPVRRAGRPRRRGRRAAAARPRTRARAWSRPHRRAPARGTAGRGTQRRRRIARRAAARPCARPGSTSRGMILAREKPGWRTRVAVPPGTAPPRVRRPFRILGAPPRAGPASAPGRHARPDVPARHRQARLRRPGARAAPGVGRAAHVRPAARPERRRAALELPRRADHGQQPDGRPPRLGPDVQGPVPALPRDARRGPALPERVRLPGPVGRGQRRARPGLHLEARHRGVRHRPVRDACASSGS